MISKSKYSIDHNKLYFDTIHKRTFKSNKHKMDEAIRNTGAQLVYLDCLSDIYPIKQLQFSSIFFSKMLRMGKIKKIN